MQGILLLYTVLCVFLLCRVLSAFSQHTHIHICSAKMGVTWTIGSSGLFFYV